MTGSSLRALRSLALPAAAGLLVFAAAADAQTIAPPPAADPMLPAPSLMRGPTSVADLAEELLDAVVNISTAQRIAGAGRGIPRLEAPEGSPLQEFFDDLLKDGEGPGSQRVQSLGSGFVIDPSGIVITNNHVIADADEITVNFSDGSQLPAELIGVDPKTDIAVLKVASEKPLKAVRFGDSETARIGDWVMAIGNPFGLGGSVTVGIVSARGRNINAGPYDSFIQTDAAINRGNSGGPLFNMNGEVIGINTAIISPTGGSIGIGFSIPSLLAENVVNQLREFGETRRGWLGIRLQEVTREIAEGLELADAKGALVMGVVPGGPSDNGALQVGDVIVGFDGREIATSRDLPRIVAETPVGKTVKVDILRKPAAGEPVTPLSVEITLGRLEDGEKLMAEGEASEPDSAQEPSSEESGDAAAEPGLQVLGMSLSDIDEASRTRFDLAEDLTGAVITEVAPGSAAAEEGIEPGNVIKEVAQEVVASAAEAREKLAELKSAGRKNALLLIAGNTGELRFVIVPID